MLTLKGIKQANLHSICRIQQYFLILMYIKKKAGLFCVLSIHQQFFLITPSQMYYDLHVCVFEKRHFTQSTIKPLFRSSLCNFFPVIFTEFSLSLKDLLREKQSIKPREPFIILAQKQGENMLLSQQKKKRDHLYISRLPTSKRYNDQRNRKKNDYLILTFEEKSIALMKK